MTNEELEQKVKRLEEQLTEVRIELLERKAPFIPYKPYEVKVPDDIDDYYYTNEYGKVDYLEGYNSSYEKNKYIRGLAFKTEEEAEQYDKERILLFKLHKWAEEHNEGWTPNWKDGDEIKYFIIYDNRYEELRVDNYSTIKEFFKLPYFKSEEIAEQFIDEFGDEIVEVLGQ